MRNVYAFRLLPLLLLFIISCQKDITETIAPATNNIYQSWLKENGGAYKDGKIVVRTPGNIPLTGELDWSKAVEYVWKGNSYVDIPFLFKGKDKIEGDEIIPTTSFTLVLKLKEDSVLEGAIRTTSYNVSMIGEQGKTNISTIESYQKLNGEYLNMWQKVNESKAYNKLYRKKQLSGQTFYLRFIRNNCKPFLMKVVYHIS